MQSALSMVIWIPIEIQIQIKVLCERGVEVTGTMVLLQRFESKVYENGCNALTTACNATHSYAILVHSMRFALEQMQTNETQKSPCHNTWEIW